MIPRPEFPANAPLDMSQGLPLFVHEPGRVGLRHFLAFERELGTVDPGRVRDVALGVMQDVSGLLIRRGVMHYVCDGTLLGLWRDNGFIGGDNDVDFRVDRAALNTDLIRAFADLGFFAFKRSTVKGTLINLGLFRQGVLVDLYGCEARDGRDSWEVICRNARLGYRLPFEGVMPHRFQGIDIRVPVAVEAHLDACFGPGWRQPEGDWDGLFSHRALWRVSGNLPDLMTLARRYRRARPDLFQDRGRLADVAAFLRLAALPLGGAVARP